MSLGAVKSKALAGQTLSAARKLNETYLVGASLRVLGSRRSGQARKMLGNV